MELLKNLLIGYVINLVFMWWGMNRKIPITDLYLENFAGSSDVWIKVLIIKSNDIVFTIPSKNPKTFISFK